MPAPKILTPEETANYRACAAEIIAGGLCNTVCTTRGIRQTHFRDWCNKNDIDLPKSKNGTAKWSQKGRK
jgi:hypothetical protein